jgi:hypothetical protein
MNTDKTSFYGTNLVGSYLRIDGVFLALAVVPGVSRLRLGFDGGIGEDGIVDPLPPGKCPEGGPHAARRRKRVGFLCNGAPKHQA